MQSFSLLILKLKTPNRDRFISFKSRDWVLDYMYQLVYFLFKPPFKFFIFIIIGLWFLLHNNCSDTLKVSHDLNISLCMKLGLENYLSYYRSFYHSFYLIWLYSWFNFHSITLLFVIIYDLALVFFRNVKL